MKSCLSFLVSFQHLDHAGGDINVANLRLMEPNGVGQVVVGLTHYGPQLHSNLGRELQEICGEILDLVLGQSLFERSVSLQFLDQSGVLIDGEVFHLVKRTIDKNIFDRYLTIIVLNEIVERNDEESCKTRRKKYFSF